MINFLKFVSLRIVNGFLFGIGFVAIFIVGAHYIKSMFDEPKVITMNEPKGDIIEPQETEFTKELSIITYKDESSNNKLKILGKIKNVGAISWGGIELQAELFLEGEFVDECQEYISKLKPNAEENFKISCGGCGDYILPAYDKLSLRVVSAHKNIF